MNNVAHKYRSLIPISRLLAFLLLCHQRLVEDLCECPVQVAAEEGSGDSSADDESDMDSLLQEYEMDEVVESIASGTVREKGKQYGRKKEAPSKMDEKLRAKGFNTLTPDQQRSR